MSQTIKEDDNTNPNIPSQPLTQEENTNLTTISHQLPKQETSSAENPSNQNASNHIEQAGQEPEPEPELWPQGLFVYGSLMTPEFLSWVLTGSSENHEIVTNFRQPATLRGYRRVAVLHADYPALIPGSESDQVEGFFVRPPTRSQWKKLDDFEGESYRRQYVHVEISSDWFDSRPRQMITTTTTMNTAVPVGIRVPAFVYLWQDSIDRLLPDQNWSYAYFREHRLEDWLDLFDGMEMVGDD